ncbi:Ig-like domain-containing protein [Listeria booriae]|uniref:Ig-like domain-containing protein n=1 Tax=Listeria booriae TaxID=1552123 RepID=UPI001626F8E3|nr:Ig-like domain-containing protein [Listeria booriae]MBC2036853.1 hypothetical protein [Listeria booriae]
MLYLAAILIFVGLLTIFSRKTSFKKGMSLFLAIGMVALILAGCSGSEDDLTKETPTKQEKKTPKLNIKAETAFTSAENGTVTITGKTKPNAELTLTPSGQAALTTTANDQGEFSFTLNDIQNDGTAVLTSNWEGQDKSKELTYTANETYVAKIEQEKKVAEAKRIEAEKKEQARVAEEQKKEAARVAEEARKTEEARKAEEKRVADAKAEQEKQAQAAEEARKQQEAEAARKKSAQAEVQPHSNEQGQMVYITATGKRYHFDPNCRGLNNSNGETQVTLSEAQSQGLTKCKFE